MAKIPSAQDINRSVPQYSRPVVGLTPDPSGRALQQFGEGIARTGFQMADGEKRMREQEELAYAESEFLRRQAQTINELAENPNYDTYNDIYNKSANDALKTSSGMITDPRTRSLFAAKLAPRIETARGSVMDMARRKRGETSLAKTLELTDANLSARRGAADPVTKSALLRQAEMAIDANVNEGFIDPVRAYGQKKDLYERAALDDFEDAPLADKINAVKYARGEYAPEGGFDGAYKLVAENEGGFTPSDGASGAPAIFGINRKWFPTEFDEVKELYTAGKVDEAKALAQQFYKQEFWDKNKLDRFDAATQAVLFDGAINHRAEFTKELISAADSGATPSELIKMREREYMRLGSKAEYAPSLGGWLNRLENVKKHTGDAYEYFKALPVEKQSRLAEEAIKLQQDAVDRERVVKAINGDGYIDTSDKNQVKILDDYFRDTVLPNAVDMNGYERNAFLVEQIASAGAMPKSIMADIKGKLFTGNDEQVIEASDFVLQLQTAAPELAATVSEKDLQVAVHVSEAIASGIPAKEAVAMSRANLEIENKPLYERRKTELKQDTVKSDMETSAVNFFDSFIPFVGSEADVNTQQGAALAADYRMAYERMYLQSGSVDASKKFAERIISGRYAETGFNGGTIMQYAPEKYYAVPRQDNEWMQVDFEKWRQENYPEMQNDSGEYFIQPDMRTMREASVPSASGVPAPTYKVVRLNKETGMYDVMDKRWSPDKKKLLDGLYDEAIKERQSIIERRKSQKPSPLSGAYGKSKIGNTQ